MNDSGKSYAGKRLIITSVFLLCLAGALAVTARTTGRFAEWYSVTVYPVIVSSVGRLSAVAHFSVGELAVIALPLFMIADVVRCRKHFKPFLIHLLFIASLLAFLYTANCGVNYYRRPFVDKETVAEAQFREKDLADFCEYIADRLNECCGSAESSPEYPQGIELAETARSSMEHLAESYSGLQGYYPIPKQLTVLSGVFSGMGVSGIYSPFTVEANINGEMPDMEKPFTACHELSHLKGYMNEGEANYIGWLACINSEDPAFRRSGWLIGWSYAAGALRRVDPERFTTLLETLPEDAVQELLTNHEFWVTHENRSSEIQDRVNDSYLKANGQNEGIQTYGQLTTLMLLWYLNK